MLVCMYSRTTDTQWRHKSKKSENLGRCGRQNMLRSYLKIWEWELIFGRAVKAISSPGVRSPWYHHNLALEVIMKMHALVSKMKQFDKCASFVCRNNWNGCQIVIYLINNFKICTWAAKNWITCYVLLALFNFESRLCFEYFSTYRNYLCRYHEFLYFPKSLFS